MVLAIATAGLVYELGMAAVASYVLGDSVRQFSIVIGAYLSALGFGAYLSRYVERDLAATFVNVELSAALVGGLSSPGLFVVFSLGASFQVLLIVVVVAVGTLVGIELPLLMRILESRLSFKDLVAHALTYDYAGALLGSLGFSLYLVPRFGLVQTSVVCGLLNAAVALAATWLLFGNDTQDRRRLRIARWSACGVVLTLFVTFLLAPKWVSLAESRSYGHVQHAEDTAYQRIMLTQREGALELYLNGHLQFSSRDECRYHEALVHPALALVPHARKILVGGGGDGLALREILKWPSIERVLLVDLDPAMTDLARSQPLLANLNRHSLDDPRVTVENDDAFRWIEHDTDTYDAIILDFPDPTTYGVGKLFTTTFYARLRPRLSPNGILMVQATSPFLSPGSYWSIERTIAAVGYHTQPIRVFLPSFGDWGFVLAKSSPPQLIAEIPQEVTLNCLDKAALSRLTEFPHDSFPGQVVVNRLANQTLVHTYLDEAKRLD
jgi:spermidine synthase